MKHIGLIISLLAAAAVAGTALQLQKYTGSELCQATCVSDELQFAMARTMRTLAQDTRDISTLEASLNALTNRPARRQGEPGPPN